MSRFNAGGLRAIQGIGYDAARFQFRCNLDGNFLLQTVTMVIKVMKWPLRQLLSKKYQVNLVLNRLDGLSATESEESKLYVDLKWKGPKSALGSRFRSMKRDKTNALPVENSGCVTWDKEFEHVCVLTNDKVGVFQPWHVYFVLCKVIIRMATIGFVSSLGN